MKLRLSHKLFLANLGIILALLVVMIGVNYATSKNMLNDFIHDLERKELKGLSEVLSRHYQRNRSWGDLIRDNRRWHVLINSNIETKHLRRPMSRFTDGPPGRGFPGRPKSFDNGGFGPPSPLPATDFLTAENSPKPSAFTVFFNRLALLDAEKNALIESPMANNKFTYQEILLENKIVGWLALGVQGQGSDPLTQHLLYQQRVVTACVAALGCLIAAIVSFFLSQHIIGPIKNLTRGAKRLATRDFDVDIEVNTKDELNELAISFNHVARELSSYEARQKRWLMDISHELRTPLTILRGEIESMVDGVTECRRDNMLVLKNDILQINRLINDLHELSTTDTLSFNLCSEEVNLHKLLQNHVERYRARFDESDLLLHQTSLPDPYFVKGDSARLSQVVYNLLENSLSYINRPGELWIDEDVTEQGLIVQFQDSGPGVPEPSVPHIFDHLYRVDTSRNRDSGGTGLGLTICKNIIEAHGGTISACKSSRGGLCVTIQLPLSGQTYIEARLSDHVRSIKV